MTVLIIILVCIYFLLNVTVSKRINEANYLNEERRTLHKKLIWYLPFIGPLITKSFWAIKDKDANDEHLEIMTKDKRNKDQGGFYESGAGMH